MSCRGGVSTLKGKPAPRNARPALPAPLRKHLSEPLWSLSTGQLLCHPPGVELRVDVSSDHRQEAKVWGAPEPLVLEMAPLSKAKGSLCWGVGNVQEPAYGHGS